ncbi:unnamed protein product [Cuscuta epithymum]|uniref:DDE Tnp4 domain-containing protein n=1 Tax=Cuscuta epithymum TaxID=186058 RepID=A0AAV0FGA9_9ASTE|nr:unnamed protein product [Cuscuta epithymum]
MSEISSEIQPGSLSKSSTEDDIDNDLDESESEGNSSTSFADTNKNYMGAVAIGSAIYYNNYLQKRPCYDRNYSGWAFIMSILNGHEKRCHNNFRMHKEVFFGLCAQLVNNYGLKPNRSVTVEEQVATFMMVVGTNEGNRQLQEMFQRSGFTISRSFHNVLKACTKMSIDWVRPFSDNASTHPHIQGNPRYWPHFKDCIGAIDGTHIKAKIPLDKQVPFIGRKGFTSQNVMVACDFDMCFTFVLPGWEGSAHDTRIFYSALRDPSKNFPQPHQDKYYLVDAGYPNVKGFLSPYKGNKYHIPDFKRAASYNNQYEVFNHVHSSLRSVIERSFGVWKKKFQIMDTMPVNIGWNDQICLVPATMAVHNFIRKNDPSDDDFFEAEGRQGATSSSGDEEEDDTLDEVQFPQSDEAMTKLRDGICASIMFGRTGVPMH